MLRAYKYRIYPTEEQKVLFTKTFGCVRVVYNWALDIKSNLYKESQESISRFALQSKLRDELKKEKPWLKETNSQSLQYALLQLDTAFKNFFKKNGKYPNFKSKHDRQSFTTRNIVRWISSVVYLIFQRQRISKRYSIAHSRATKFMM